MIGIGAEFVLLDANKEKVISGQMKTRDLDQKVGGKAIRLAVDHLGQRHLLVPTAGCKVKPDHSAAGVALAGHAMMDGGTLLNFVDVHCHLPHLNGVFERMVDDIVERLASGPENPPSTCRTVVAEWKELLKSAGLPIGREKVEGIVGELTMLKLILGADPVAAVETWKGPAGGLHDFVAGLRHLEVKATASLDGKVVSISNLDQLDPGPHELWLGVIHLVEDTEAPSIDILVDELTSLGVPKATLVAKIHQAGYVVGSAADRDFRFGVKSVRIWNVGTEFPGLRRSHIDPRHLNGVGRVRYELNLDTAPEGIHADQVDAQLAQWVSEGANVDG
ncbi:MULTISPECIES: PD-(D/E)XK motif protein [unclassified Nocardioides]|uniref:PD-(D/E)XK motif protein n=1 Tax=unclassified Nocardioides TaxID=2615069 RepID=UPI0006FDD278|nr:MULTISPECIES: PD-(D/E)XK motif protein [unclassified Nocardioides]KRA31224.1 hypothetical protein ASD81_17325 [Nocardioides sp. Root614]KRA87845.1 hypothetical protein ASD84_17595 [Nocardioides sp. Root682]